MLRSCIIVLSCLFALISEPTAAYSQTESRQIVITSEITCSTCQITATRIATLGTEADTLDLSFLLVSPCLTRKQDGNFYLTPTMSRTPGVYEFASDGGLIRQIGRLGRGPGEYTRPSSIALGRDDTLFVFNSWPPRINVFSPEGMFVRSSSIPFRVELALALASGEILAMGKRSTPELLGLPLHLLTPTGESIRTFGDENPIDDPRDISLYRRHISLAPEGTVWVSPEFRYQVERWDMDGHLIETIVREAEWFPPRTPTVEEPLTRERPIPRTPKPMPPVFHGAYQDSEGLLWLNSVVTDPDWRKHFEEIKAENPRSLPWDGRFYNTLIEVIDPNTGKLLTSQRLPFFNWGFAGEKLIASRRTLESGLVVIDIWRLTLSR